MPMMRIFVQYCCLIIFLQLSVIPPARTSTNGQSPSSWSASIARGANITKPCCKAKCGNLTVPYPFGVGLGTRCSAGKSFDIHCNNSFNPPKPFISTANLEVIGIGDNEVRVKNVVAYQCFDSVGNKTSGNLIRIDLASTPYTFSDANKFTVVGCDDTGLINRMEGRHLSEGCTSYCWKIDYLFDRQCTGIGCCQTAIPKGLKKFSASLDSYHRHTIESFGQCGYAFLAEQNSFVFRTSDLWDATFYNRTEQGVPIVLDWAIGDKSCREAKKWSDYACQGNSECVDSNSGDGYRCRCNEGYEGNPYLSPGCSDIDECKESSPCDEHAVCINTPGNFKCTCWQGYIGDGRNNTGGCIAPSIARSSEFPVIKFSLGNSSLTWFEVSAESEMGRPIRIWNDPVRYDQYGRYLTDIRRVQYGTKSSDTVTPNYIT